MLNQSGFIVIIVSNQRGIARGIMTENDLKDIHQKMCCKLKQESAIITDISSVHIIIMNANAGNRKRDYSAGRNKISSK